MDTKTPATKVCTACQKRKAMALFSPRKAGKHGKASVCKRCVADKAKIRYSLDPEKHRLATKKSVQKNPQRKIDYNKEYAQRETTKISKRRRQKAAYASAVDEFRAKKRADYKLHSKERVKKSTEHTRSMRKNLDQSPSDIAHSYFRMRVEEVPRDLIEAKRIQLKINKLLKEKY